MSRTLLRFESVDACYGAAQVLHQMDLSIEAGERFALIGRNGVGKTTVVNTLLGVATMRRGSVTIDGKPLRRPRPYDAARQGIAVVPQGRCIVSNLSIEENLRLGAAPGRKGPWDLESIYALFPILKERAHTPGTALSGGQQPWRPIGRALMSNPALILLDEPTEGLAPVIVDQLADIFNRVADMGTALLLIEQNMSLVVRVAHRYCAMAKGSVVAQGAVNAESIDQLHQHIMI